MDNEMVSFFHNAFCNRLRTIKSEMQLILTIFDLIHHCL